MDEFIEIGESGAFHGQHVEAMLLIRIGRLGTPQGAPSWTRLTTRPSRQPIEGRGGILRRQRYFRATLRYSQAITMGRLLLLVVGLAVAVLAAWVLGALVAALFAPGWLGLGFGGGSALLVCVLLPILLDRKLLLSARKTDAGARSMLGQAFLLINGVLLAGILAAWPRQARGALESRGDWVLFSPSASQRATALQTLVTRVTKYIPRSGASSAPRVRDTSHPAGSASAAARALAAPPASSASGQSAAAAALPTTSLKRGIASAASAAAQGSIPEDRAVQGPAEVFRKYADSVVVITAMVDFDSKSPLAELYRHLGIRTMESFGSGFIVDKRGLVVTNHHVVNDAKSLKVKLRDGKVIPKVTRLAELRTHDLALLQIDAQDLRAVALADDGAVQIGDPSIAIGCPQGLEYTLTTGIVSALRKQGKTEMIQMQTTIAPGSSGGPLFADNGALIGVNTATEGAGLNYAVRVQHVRELLAAPRSRHEYQAFTGGVQIRRLDTEGIEPGPTDRGNLTEALRLWGSALDQCIETLPEGAYVTYHFKPGKSASPSALLALEPARESNLTEQLDRCSSGFLRMVMMQVQLLLVQEHSDSFERGFSVIAEVGGLRAAGGREDAVVRLTLQFGGR